MRQSERDRQCWIWNRNETMHFPPNLRALYWNTLPSLHLAEYSNWIYIYMYPLPSNCFHFLDGVSHSMCFKRTEPGQWVSGRIKTKARRWLPSLWGQKVPWLLMQQASDHLNPYTPTDKHQHALGPPRQHFSFCQGVRPDEFHCTCFLFWGSARTEECLVRTDLCYS